MTDMTRADSRSRAAEVAEGWWQAKAQAGAESGGADYDPGARAVKHRLLSALRQALGEAAFHVSNSGIGPGPAAWATLIIDSPHYVDITVRPADTNGRTTPPGAA